MRGQFGDERRRQRGLVTGIAVDRGDQQPPPGPAHRRDQQPPLLGEQRRPRRHLVTEAVEDVEQPLGAQDRRRAEWCWATTLPAGRR